MFTQSIYEVDVFYTEKTWTLSVFLDKLMFLVIHRKKYIFGACLWNLIKAYIRICTVDVSKLINLIWWNYFFPSGITAMGLIGIHFREN